MPDLKEKTTPPYGTFSNFQAFLAHLKDKGVPTHVDASVFPSSFSGSAQSQIRTGLRFLGLTRDGGETTPALATLVGAVGTDAWEATLRTRIVEAYKPIVEGVNLEKSTLSKLADAFRDRAGVRGSVLRKSIRFYLDALKASGVPFSQHFLRGLSAAAGDRAEARNGRAAKRAAPPPPPRQTEEKSAHEDEHDSGYERWPFPLPGRKPVILSVPPDLREEEWALIDTMVRGYIRLNAGKVNKKETAAKADAP